ncbi:MAG TPA: bifunctional DNA-formamidopyrimidine glycosylase/DNA-(apurinic or apyrimidinic site) lyase [Burkholderiales bacterium]|jgi:formamidopyrimidine-DNA glycosylase|nr:bifunctional DNA-formamidopyrimidine glycosylase/DNA-(apurinic or apyrimidinic site) lyase [Burkholderiales bacterium]
MPELPEVETTRRGLAPHLVNQRIRAAIVRNGALRVPVPRNLPKLLAGATISSVDRRGKYLLIGCGHGTLIVHLGMSGRLWLVEASTPAATHDHFDLVLENGTAARLRDPRRFGLVVWQEGDALAHPLLASIGPEPLSPQFDGAALYNATRNRSAAIKLVLMDSHVVAGVGNIYASEALFRARINPKLAAHRISRARYDVLAAKVRETLEAAIQAGGSTLRDYVGGDGRAGFFQNEHLVYGRAGEPCYTCGTAIRQILQGQRSTFYCPVCQRR